jgi:hypothetical protein
MTLSEDVFDFAQQSAALRTVFYLDRAFEFHEQLALALVQFPGGLHPHFDEEIAFAVSVEQRNAFAADPKSGA